MAKLLAPPNRASCSQVQQLLSSPSRHKLLVLAGQFVEDSGALVLQKGLFSPSHLLQLFREEEVSSVATRLGFEGHRSRPGPPPA